MRRFVVAIAVAGLLSPFAAAQVTNGHADSTTATRIRQEEEQHSQIMRTLHFLTDVYGPRVTGSPGLKAAGEWAIKTMESWEFANGHLEPWDFGHPGWVNERVSVHVVSPVKAPLVVEPLAWTPGTHGTLSASAVNILLPEGPPMPDMPGRGRGAAGLPPQHFGPTYDELRTYLNSVRAQVRGKIVLVGRAAFVPVNLGPPPGRLSDEEVRRRYDPDSPPRGRGDFQAPTPPNGSLTTRQVDREVDEFLVANGALARINDAARPHGQIIAFSNRTYDVTKALPTVVMRNEDYGRLARILADATPVEIEMTIENKEYPEGTTAYNAIAEIAGSDKKDEVVMVGGHLDSWHSATGATDNAIGCATTMEAARILKAIGARPRRTIRVALWSGEEEGILGSVAYVGQHFGSFENPKPEFGKLDAYLNIDSGTGRARGATVFGPPEAAAIVRQALAPFEDLGLVGAVGTNSRTVGGTDSTAFNNAGLPGIGFGQDPIEYNSHTHHTNLDHYERIIEADVKTSAMAIAAVLYELAMRDDMVPRFTKDTMPAPVPARTGSQ
jgi:carboxypeptidase Q